MSETPANREGLKQEPGPTLRMAKDTASGDALPLWAIPVGDLWQTSAADGDLTLREYKRRGSLEKAVEQDAFSLAMLGLSELSLSIHRSITLRQETASGR